MQIPSTSSETAGQRSLPPLQPIIRPILTFVVLAACAVHLAQTIAAAPNVSLSEYEIKAAYLFNFTRFVEWPAHAFSSPAAPIVLGVLGDNPFGDLLRQTAAGKTVNGRAVVVKQFRQDQDLRECQILFIASSEQRYGNRIREQLRQSTVLTVGDAPHAEQRIGIITFLVEDNKVRLQIDLDAASAAQLKISSKLITVSRIVEHGK